MPANSGQLNPQFGMSCDSRAAASSYAANAVIGMPLAASPEAGKSSAIAARLASTPPRGDVLLALAASARATDEADPLSADCESAVVSAATGWGAVVPTDGGTAARAATPVGPPGPVARATPTAASRARPIALWACDPRPVRACRGRRAARRPLVTYFIRPIPSIWSMQSPPPQNGSSAAAGCLRYFRRSAG